MRRLLSSRTVAAGAFVALLLCVQYVASERLHEQASLAANDALKTNAREPPMDNARIQLAMAAVDSQVESLMSKIEPPTAQEKEKQKPKDPVREITDASVLHRFKATQQEKVGALNSLDLTVGNITDQAPPPKKAYPRNVVASFGSIAAETVQRSHYALLMLKNQKQELEQTIETQQKELYQWVSAQKTVAEQAIQAQEKEVARIQDEIMHLEHVYQDAVSKERSYQVQANMLISERQLQRTPPVMPVEAAAALPEAQYQDAIKKLSHWRRAALQLMAQSKEQINTRQQRIETLNAWIKNSKSILENWATLQNSLIEQHLTRLRSELEQNGKRTEYVAKISNEATAAFKTYANVVARLDLKTQIAWLEEELKTYSTAKPANPYEEAHFKAVAAALKMELAALQKKLASVEGDEQCAAPPVGWGVVSAFPGGQPVVFPEPVRYPAKDPANDVNGVNMNIGRVFIQPNMQPYMRVPPNVHHTVPTGREDDHVYSPNFPAEMAGIGFNGFNPYLPSAAALQGSAGAPLASASLASASKSSSLLEAASDAAIAPSSHAPAPSVQGVPPPPAMPDVPAPPSTDFIL